MLNKPASDLNNKTKHVEVFYTKYFLAWITLRLSNHSYSYAADEPLISLSQIRRKIFVESGLGLMGGNATATTTDWKRATTAFGWWKECHTTESWSLTSPQKLFGKCLRLPEHYGLNVEKERLRDLFRIVIKIS